ncbi:Lead, cadmium, zinc and mercury transporting ATPase; Copper-translocating P-type ATPase [hydrothermal vent metagenome]|uniref:Lead, cadmium, zinc and mercury transporting ATPase Copper-translocating P-type ATPase n=1 Tax=hydrothermal vent metagenome TaxID=652676 RepID=A0A3B1C7K9_9ZZZZ
MPKTTDDYKKLSIEDTLKELQADRSRGLSEGEAQERLARYGLNEIPEKEETTLRRILKRFWGPIPWMIEVAAILSAMVQKWEDFVIIMIMLFVNAGLDFYQESKAISALKTLKEKLAKKAIVLRDGTFKETDAKYLVPGDVIKLKIGDVIPSDAKLLEGDYLLVDQSALTGESLPVEKKAEDVVYSNSIVKQGEMLAVVVNTGLNTYFGKTVALVAKAEREEKSHYQKLVISIGDYLIVITLLLTIVIVYAGIHRGETLIELLRFALVLAVASIPVALPAVLSVTMAVGAVSLARKRAIVSRLVAIEELSGVDILCADKTGTLTKNQLLVENPVIFDGFTERDLVLYAELASREENKDPIDMAIFEYGQKMGYKDITENYQQIKFIPFDPVRKRTEASIKSDIRTFTVAKGAVQVILELCGNDVDRKKVEEIVEDFAEEGFRTIAVATKEEDEKHFKLVGIIPLFDPPRDDSKSVIESTRKLGVDVKMITGDNIAIARQIARLLGIGDRICSAVALRSASYRETVLLGEVLARAIYKKLQPGMTETEAEKFAKAVIQELENEFKNIQIPEGYIKKHESEIIDLIEHSSGFAEVYPEDKYIIVEKLQKGGHMVAMTGDGVNDAPALKKADCGIAVSGATDAARAAADVILTAPGLSVIEHGIELSRIIFGRMKSYTIYRIAETIRVILFMSLAILMFNFYPVTAIMIILLALLNDIPILTLAYDNASVQKKPTKWNLQEILTVSTVLGIAGVLSSFLLFFILEKYLHFSRELIQSLIFLKLLVAGHLTIFLTRTPGGFFWQKPYPSALLLWASFSTKILGTIFAAYGWFIAPIGWKYALYIWIYAVAWFIFNDFVKVGVYKFLRKERIV